MSLKLHRRDLAFPLLLLASCALFWAPLRATLLLSENDNRYSHLIVIPIVSACLLYWERKRIFSGERHSPHFAWPFLAAGILLYGVGQSSYLDRDLGLSLAVLALVLTWAAGFVFSYGIRAFKAALFAFLFLLLMVPIPQSVMERIIFGLQSGSAYLSYRFFRLADIPMFRTGFTIELPGVSIQVAKECSSIHSGWALFITGLLVGHAFLRSLWPKLCLSLLTIPVAVFTNSIRIFTLWWLATHVDMGFLTGDLHHRGGILFSLISLSILLTCVAILRKMEGGPAHRPLAGP